MHQKNQVRGVAPRRTTGGTTPWGEAGTLPLLASTGHNAAGRESLVRPRNADVHDGAGPRPSAWRERSGTPNPPALEAAVLSFLFVYTTAVVLWLLLGLVPALGHRFPAIGNQLSGWASGAGWFAQIARRLARASSATYAAKGPLALFYLFSLLNLGLGVFLVKRRPHDRVAQLLAIGMIGTAAAFNLPSHSFIDAFQSRVVDDLHIAFHVVSGVAYMYAVVLFPDGRISPRWLKRPLAALALLTAVAGPVLLSRGSLVTNFVVFFGVVIPLLGMVAQSYRVRHGPTEDDRRQARILRLAVAPAFIVGLVFAFISGLRAWVSAAGSASLIEQVFPLLFAVIPIVLFIGILRHGIWGIEVVVSKALLYGVLTAFFAAIYVLIVVVIGRAIGSGDRVIPGLSVLATAVIAVAFEPVRQRMKRFANRLVYGDRSTPYEVLTSFSRRMAESLSVEEIIPRMAEAAARGVGAARSRVRVFLPDGASRSVTWPPQAGDGDFDWTVTIYHDGEPIGDMWVAKPAGQALTEAEERLLGDLASEAGLSLRNARLTVELRARLEEISHQAKLLRESRQRLVAAQDVAARRVERNIHDGAQQHLVALKVKLRLAENQLDGSPEEMQRLLHELQTEAQEALDALRDLARGIYPPLLVDSGLPAALQAYAGKASLPVALEAVGVGRYPQEVEAAVYFCCAEALQNVAKYAMASNVVVRLAHEQGELAFSVTDDGAGFDPDATSTGTGIQGMTDRVEALGGTLQVLATPGGGTTILGRVPAAAREPAHAGPSDF
jgi:signal transduction histidine kinase